MEDKNVKNQKFLLKDVGRSKVEVLSCRYNSIYKLNIQYCTKRIEEENDIQTLLDCSSINIIVSCVDNNKARHIIDNVFNYGSKNRTVIYIDTGNSGSEGDFTGQTVVGYKTNTQIILPSVGNYFEEIEKEEEDIEEASCGEVLPNQIQNISANITSAVNVFNIMNIIITFNKIPADLVLFNATKITTNNMKLYDKNLDNLSYKSAEKKLDGIIMANTSDSGSISPEYEINKIIDNETYGLEFILDDYKASAFMKGCYSNVSLTQDNDNYILQYEGHFSCFNIWDPN